MRKQGHPGLNAWLSAQPRADLAISVIALLEIERRDQAAGARPRVWLTTDIPAAFAGSILAVDERVARQTARLHVPDPMPEMDALVAATVLVHDLTLATRNTRDFQRTGVAVLDPWGL